MDERSPYAPPVSDVSVIKERKGTAWKAVLFGVLIDIGGTMLLGVVVATVAFAVLAAQGKDASDFEQLFNDPLSPMMIAMSFAGGLLSVLGGYVCSRIAKQNEMKLAGVMAIISILYSVTVDSDELTAYTLFLYVATIASIFFGSWVGMKRNQQRRSST
jgi:peptidoglycan/LPS O-acetylase OafA/YrhL